MFMYRMILVDSLGVNHELHGVYTAEGSIDLQREFFSNLAMTHHIGISKLFTEEGRPHLLILEEISA